MGIRRLGFVVFSSVLLLQSIGCMGTFQTARVVPFSAGAFYFGTTQGSSSDAASMAGLVIDGG